jgi:integrase
MAARKRRRSSGTGSVFKDKYGFFNAQVCVGYTPSGKRRYIRKRSKREAEVVAWLTAQTIKSGNGIPIAPDRITVEQFLLRWLETVQRSSRYSTHRGYAQICRDYVVPRIGRVRMASVTTPHIQAILDSVYDAGKARNTIRNVKSCLLAATAEIEHEYPGAYRAVRSAKVPQTPQAIEVITTIIHALTAEQAQRLLVVVERDRLKALYWVALLLGLRRGEILGLRSTDVDLEARTITVRGALQRQAGKGMVRVPPKTAASAAPLPLPDVLLPVLVEHLAMLDEERTYAKWREHGLLFPTSIGTPIGDRNLVRHFKALLRRASLPSIRFHDLRHSCATLLITLGVHPRIVMEILRHAQISTTMNIYGHTVPEINRAAANALGDLVQPATLDLAPKAPIDRRRR